MGRDRITELTIQGLRTIDSLTLPLRGLTVLIGENGTGKSSILEACEILRRASGPQFVSEFNSIHGGLFSLLRDGASELRLLVRVEDEEYGLTQGKRGNPPLKYVVSLAREGAATLIAEEQLLLDPIPDDEFSLALLFRNREVASVYNAGVSQLMPVPVGPTQLMLGSSGIFPPHPQIPRMREALEHIEMHLPFEVLPSWAAQAHDRRSAMRSPMLLQGADRLDRLGSNLANAYHTLRMEYGEEHWRTTMEYIRLGLGEEIETITTRVDPGGGAIALWMKLRNRDRQLPASVLADGVLAYLAFVAMFRLHAARTLLAFDEPELHLNPALLVRVVDLFESIAVDYPVILATHSDRLLDALRDPASSVRVCETDGLAGSTQVRGLDPDALGQWLEGYRGLGDLRGAGHLSSVLKPEGSA